MCGNSGVSYVDMASRSSKTDPRSVLESSVNYCFQKLFLSLFSIFFCQIQNGQSAGPIVPMHRANQFHRRHTYGV